MSTYTPDKFVLIDYGPAYPPKERYAILAGFYGALPEATLGSVVALLIL